MSHGRARLTVHGRLLIVQRHQQGWKQAHIAAAMGVSRKCVKTWIDRYAALGEAGLVTRSSHPHSSPTRTSAAAEGWVLAIRGQRRCGREEISAQTGVPARTVSRVLARHRVPHLAVLDPITGEVIRSSKATAVRYERSRPGELVHMDHGIDRIEELMTDNAWAYKYSLREVCAGLGIRQIFIKAHCPWQNGKVERLNRTLQVEWAYREVFTSNDDRTAALAPWLEHYNTQRRHSALGGLPPISRLRPT